MYKFITLKKAYSVQHLPRKPEFCQEYGSVYFQHVSYSDS